MNRKTRDIPVFANAWGLVGRSDATSANSAKNLSEGQAKPSNKIRSVSTNTAMLMDIETPSISDENKQKQSQIYTADSLMYLVEVRAGVILKRTIWSAMVMFVTSPKLLFDRITRGKKRTSWRK